MATGLEDLLRRFDGEQPEMALLLVKASLGSVVSGLADTYGASPLIEEASVRAASRTDEAMDTAGWIAAVEQRDESWICVYVALGEVVDLERDLVSQVAIDLSDTLSTQAIAFVVHRPSPLGEGSGAAAELVAGKERIHEPLQADFEAFSEGETTDRVRWKVNGAIEVYESKGREAPDEPSCVSLDLANRLFADRGIYVPACSPRSRAQQAWLALWDLDPSRIRRADLFRLRGSSFFEDETLTMDVPDIDAHEGEEDSSEAVGSGEDVASVADSTSATGWRAFLQRIFPSLG